MKVKVGVVGAGTIGHRVVTYVSRQKDMEIEGVSKVSTEDAYETTKHLLKNGIKIYPAARNGKEGLKKALENFREYFEKIKNKEKIYEDAKDLIPGTIEDLIDVSDVIVDTSDGKINEKQTVAEYNKQNFYVPYNEKNHKKIKVVFQGGEKANIANVSFNAAVSYDKAIEVGNSDEPYVRQVSCNTTALSRILYVILSRYTINRIYATIVRRATDPGEEKKTILNNIQFGELLPSHHGPDVLEVFKNFDKPAHLLNKQILTSAIVVPTDQMHAHDLTITFPINEQYGIKNYPSKNDFVDLCKDSILKNRIMLVERTINTSREREIMRRKERIKTISGKYIGVEGDIFPVVIGLNSYNVVLKEDVNRAYLKIHAAVHQESIVIPDTIDAIRALMYNKLKILRDESIEITDKSLGLNE